MVIKSRSKQPNRLVPLYLKTWIYFTIMAAITLLLLWFFQFLFFDVLYYNRQEAHIKQVSADLLKKEYGTAARPSDWQNFYSVAKDQNFLIYIFTFDENDISENDYKFPSDTKFTLYSPYFNEYSEVEKDEKINNLTWSSSRKNEYLSHLMNLDKKDSFTYIEKNTNKKSNTDTVIYGGTLKGTYASSRKEYFCLIATISKNNYTVTIMHNMLLIASVIILVTSFIMSYIFSKRLSYPINKLATTADQLAKGDFNVSFESTSFTEVKQLASSLNFAKEEMRKTEQMRRDFVANVSHDLRTPLTMIKAYAEMIRDLSGRNEEKRTKHCQIIIDESNRLSTLVGDIQNLSKLQSGTSQFNITRFDLSELCKTVVHRFGIMSETQGYVFDCDLDDNAFCYGDYQKIEQVLYNLIGNALNYTGDDKKVSVLCKKTDSGFKVDIIDSGKGIDPEEIDFVWDRYYRANQKKRNIVGSGLGLNIVKLILDDHKAQYGVNSELNKGTDFWFILPDTNS